MAVVKIKVLSMIGTMPELERTTEALGRSCAFHPDNALSFYSDTSGFVPLNEINPYDEPLAHLTETFQSLGKKVSLLSYRAGEKFHSSTPDWKAYVTRVTGDFKNVMGQMQTVQQKIKDEKNEADKVSHFVGLDLDLDALRECRFIKIRFGSLPRESYEKLNAFQENPYLAFFPCTSDEYHYWGVYCAPIDKISDADRIFSGLYFERVRLTELTGSPESILQSLKDRIEQDLQQQKSIQEKLEAFWEKEKQNLQSLYSWLSEKSICFGIRRYAVRYADNFLLTGWIPADREKDVSRRLDELNTVKYTFDSAETEDILRHSPPVKLKNHKLFRPFEYLVEIYGLPNYDEADPTPLVAITYVLLYGIMFADLGQGLCISLIGWWMYRKKNMRLGKALVPCGFASAVFGTLFGSAFGFEHALDPFYKAVFGLSQKPISVMDSGTTNIIIYSAIGMGMALVIIAILSNIYSSMRRHDYTSGIFGPNGIAGLVFYASIVFGFGGQLLLGWNIINTAYILFFFIIPIIFMYFREILGGLAERNPDWKPESWSDYIVQNIFEIFEFLLSFLTNTISFIRVGAFVLVHAGMMMVVFMLADMSGGGIGAAIAILIGNIFVLCLEGLLVGIQSLRLEFYEMFSRFYDGNGRPFTPVIVAQES